LLSELRRNTHAKSLKVDVLRQKLMQIQTRFTISINVVGGGVKVVEKRRFENPEGFT
jgi:hypothetical protein